MNVHMDITEASNAPARKKGGKRRQQTKGAVGVAAARAPAAHCRLEHALSKFRSARDLWFATAAPNGDLDGDGPEFDAAQAACSALAKYKCENDFEVQRKIEIILTEPWLRETVQTDYDEDGNVFDAFLNSLQINSTEVDRPAAISSACARGSDVLAGTLQVPEALLNAITAYKQGLEAFDAVPDEQSDDFHHLWKKPHGVLWNWTSPALTREGAIAALALAIAEEDIGDSALTAPMMKAAFSYLAGGDA